MKTLALALCTVVLSACSLASHDEPDASASLIETDQARYDARLVTGGYEGVAFDVPFEIRNTTGGPLYRIGCRTAPAPSLQKWVGGRWVTAYVPYDNLCLSPPFEIAPGGVAQDTLRVAGAFPGQDFRPEFRTEVAGTYRLYVELFSSLTDDRSPLGKDLAPMGARVSNTFEVE